MTPRKPLIGLAASALLLGGCATGPYYTGPYEERYAYDDGRYYERPADPYYYDRPAYRYYDPYYPYYYGPTFGFGLSFSNLGHWRRH